MSSETAAYFSNALPDTTEIALPVPESVAAVRSEKDSSTEIGAIDRHSEEHSNEYLLLQVSGGSKEALSILFQRHARQVFHVARRILRDDAEAEDLLQEFFLSSSKKQRSSMQRRAPLYRGSFKWPTTGQSIDEDI
jgi:RNA polymerase sigma-70 factor, ECF subfamily